METCITNLSHGAAWPTAAATRVAFAAPGPDCSDEIQ